LSAIISVFLKEKQKKQASKKDIFPSFSFPFLSSSLANHEFTNATFLPCDVKNTLGLQNGF